MTSAEEVEELVEGAASDGFRMAMLIAANVARRMASSAQGVSGPEALLAYAQIIGELDRENFKQKLGYRE